MRRCIDTVVHDQAVGPVPEGAPVPGGDAPAVPEAVPADTAAPDAAASEGAADPWQAPLDTIATPRRRPKE